MAVWIRSRRVQVVGHVLDRHVHDRAVEGHEELRGAQDEENEAAPTVDVLSLPPRRAA